MVKSLEEEIIKAKQLIEEDLGITLNADTSAKEYSFGRTIFYNYVWRYLNPKYPKSERITQVRLGHICNRSGPTVGVSIRQFHDLLRYVPEFGEATSRIFLLLLEVDGNELLKERDTLIERIDEIDKILKHTINKWVWETTD